MGLELIYGLMAKYTQVFGKMGKKMEKVT